MQTRYMQYIPYASCTSSIKLNHLVLSLTIGLVLLLSGCSFTPTSPYDKAQQALFNKYPSIGARVKQVNKISHWAIKGKVGFIDKKQRQSASFHWLTNLTKQSQQLDLTTYLGINVLHLESTNNHHIIEVMNNTYQGADLDEMLRSIAHINLPTKALSFWLRGIPYLPTDKLAYNHENHLPKTLTSFYKGQQWQVNFQAYKTYPLGHIGLDSYTNKNANNSHVALATKIVLKQNDLTIKLNINQWNIL